MLFIVNFLSLIGVIAGSAALLVTRSLYWFPMVVVPVVYPILYYVTHTSLRYRHAIDPVVLLLLASAITLPFGRRSAKKLFSDTLAGAGVERKE
jgi:hypothetical protein